MIATILLALYCIALFGAISWAIKQVVSPTKVRLGQRKLTWLDRRRSWHWSTESVPGAFYSDSRDVRRCNHCGSVLR